MSSKSTKLIVLGAALVAGAAGIGACSPAESPGTANPGTGGAKGNTTGTGGNTTGTPGTGGSTGLPGTGGSAGLPGTGGSTGMPGTGGTGVVQKACATKITPMNPVLVDFEDYNGMIAATQFGTAFGGPTPHTGTAYMGPMSWGDGTTTPTLSILGGHPPGNYGLSQTVTQAALWGMGGGFWMGCADARAYKGITFWVRGSVPGATFSFTMDMESTLTPTAANPAGGGTCAGAAATCKPAQKLAIPITADWAQVNILWADFTPGMSGTTVVVPDGNNIAGFGWSVNIPYVCAPGCDTTLGPFIPMPSDLVFNLDDLAFIP